MEGLLDLKRHISWHDLEKAVSPEDWSALLKTFHSKQFPANTVIIEEGAPQTFAFVVRSGRVDSFKKEFPEKVPLSNNEITGLLHLVSQDPASATLVAAVDSELDLLDNQAFMQLLQSRPAFMASFIALISRELRSTMRIASTMRFQSKKQRRVAFFSHQKYWTSAFQKAVADVEGLEIKFFADKLTPETAVLASNFTAVCCFVNDVLSSEVLTLLEDCGVRLVLMRCAGTDNVALDKAKELKLEVTSVPAYSPFSVAEMAISLMLTLNRKIHKAYNKTRNGDFSLDGLVGFDMHGRTVGVMGTGRIGASLINILGGFGCKVLAYDLYVNKDVEKLPFVQYVSQEELFKQSDLVSVHVPLLPSTKHFLNKTSFAQMKKGVILINTSRGGLIDSQDLLDALKSGQIGAAGLDVYEGEKDYFFRDKSSEVLQDDVLTQLLTMSNVVVTSHMAFLTQDALDNIAKSSVASMSEWISGKPLGKLTNSVIKDYGANVEK